MIDLFRFVMLRSPKVPDPGSIVQIGPSPSLQQQLGDILNPTTPAAEVAARARALLTDWAGVIKSANQLAFGTQYPLFIAAVDAGAPTPPTSQTVKQIFNLDPQQLVAVKGFVADRAAAGDTLLLTKLTSDGTQVDIAALNVALRATALIANLAAGDAKPTLNPTFVFGSLPLRREQAASPAGAEPTAADSGTAAIARDNARAIRILASIPPSQLTLTQLPAGEPLGTPAKSAIVSGARRGKATAAPPLSPAVLTIAPPVAKTLDPTVDRVIKRLNLDLATMSVPQLIDAITVAATSGAPTVASVPLDLMPAASGADPGTGTLPPLPTGPGSAVTPIGIGDLLVVKQRLKRYEAADIAYIENVLRTESFKRDTRRLDRTQTTITTESDVTTEEERDTQATDRFSLQRESANTIKEDSSLKAGVAISASYGPTVSVKANLDAASSSSQEDSTKQATSYSKDVTTRAATKVTQTTKQIQTMLTLNEYEEDIHHGFDNTAGANNVSGVYQWVDKIYEAQVYNYGSRLMFDVMVPEPAAFLISQLRTQANGSLPTAPKPLIVLPVEIDESIGPWGYQTLAATYGTTNLDPPPDLFQTVAAEFAMDSLDSSKPTAKSGELKVPDGYQAYSVIMKGDVTGTNAGGKSLFGSLNVTVGGQSFGDFLSHPMASEIGSIPVTLLASDTDAFTAGIELTCKRTDRAYAGWQEKVYAAIAQSYQQLEDAYQKAVSDAATTQGVAIPGQNPDLNLILVQNELKKTCISLVTGQQYEAFGAIELSAENYPEVLLANAEVQGKYVRFLEEAFEWEQMTYFFYPYYWGRKGRWPLHVLATDPDPQFSAFLNSGYARVVFPVRPKFEQAVLHMLETGEIWNGGDLPQISSPLYVSIITELQEQQGAPGAETAQGDPWEVTLPTTLVKLRSDDKLPSWGWDKSTPPQWVELI